MNIYLVEDNEGCLVSVLPTREAAEKFLVNHGVEGWTIYEEEAC